MGLPTPPPQMSRVQLNEDFDERAALLLSPALLHGRAAPGSPQASTLHRVGRGGLFHISQKHVLKERRVSTQRKYLTIVLASFGLGSPHQEPAQAHPKPDNSHQHPAVKSPTQTELNSMWVKNPSSGGGNLSATGYICAPSSSPVLHQ